MKFSVYEFGGTRSNKIRVMGSLSVFPPPSTLSCKTRGSPGRVKTGRSQKSFGINNWHSLGKGEKSCNEQKSGKILELLDSGKRRAFLAEGVAKMHGRKAAEKRRFGKIFKKDECQIFCLRKLFWDTLVYHV